MSDQVNMGTKQALLEARQEAIRSSQSGGGGPAKRRFRLLRLLALLTLAFAIYALGTRPAWLFTPPPEPEPPAIAEASLRVVMWQQALHVRQYRTTNGRLPRSLEEAGAPPVEGISYVVTGENSYVLSGSHGTLELILTSSDSLGDFIGNSIEVIANRGNL